MDKDAEKKTEDVQVHDIAYIQARLQQAVAETNLSKTSAASLQLYAMFIIVYCSSSASGFDASIMSGVNAMHQFHDFFGLSKSSARLGLTVAIYSVGGMVSCFLAGPAADKYGRRFGMFFGMLWVLVGAILQAAAPNLITFQIGRFFVGAGITFCVAGASAYLCELSPPQWRGPLTGLYNSLWGVGAVTCTSAMYGTGKIESTLSWRLPVALQAIPPLITLAGVWFLPESPRWLLANNREEEAIEILAKYHAAGDKDSILVQLEVEEMKENIALKGPDKRWWDYRGLFYDYSARYRTMLAVATGFIGQWGGSNVTSFYLVQVLGQIGITKQDEVLRYNIGYYVSPLFSAVTGAFLTERVGRRPMFMMGNLGMMVVLIGITACTSQFHEGQSTSISNLTIAFIFFVGITHSFFLQAVGVLYPAELLQTNSRAKGMALYQFATGTANFVNTYATPVAMDRMKWRFYTVYVGWNFVQFLFVYFFFIETRGRTLEEIQDLFEHDNPVKLSKKRHHEIAGQQIPAHL